MLCTQTQLNHLVRYLLKKQTLQVIVCVVDFQGCIPSCVLKDKRVLS